MMEDWTDIIGEELGSIEEPLPADDWSVLQQKYAAVRRRRKTAAFAWAGGFTSIAAAIALVMMIIRPDSSPVIPGPIGDLNDTVTIETPSETVVTKKQRQIPTIVNVVKSSDNILVAQGEPEDNNHAEEVAFDMVKDSVSITERILADAGNTNYENDLDDANQTDYDGFDDFPYDEPKRKRIKVSVGLSGSASANPIPKMYDAIPAPPQSDMAGPGPKDSTEVETPEPAPMMRRKSSYIDRYDHEIPKSFGVSIRFHLTDRLSINSGLSYTRYVSERTRIFSGHTGKNDRQYVHYLGIPVRLDWMIVDRKHFNFYLGAGLQADKCIYATVGGERLHEKEVLMGLNGAMGLQFNVMPKVGLYFEPDFSLSLNEGSIQTYRSNEPLVVTVRGGLRFNF